MPLNKRGLLEWRLFAENGRARISALGRVEMWRGASKFGLSVAALSSGGARVTSPSLRFHIPLIEPDMQLSRIGACQ